MHRKLTQTMSKQDAESSLIKAPSYSDVLQQAEHKYLWLRPIFSYSYARLLFGTQYTHHNPTEKAYI